MVDYISIMINKYFTYLNRMGYYKYNEVYKMLYIIAVYKISLEMGEFIDNNDAKLILKGIDCIMGTDCLFDIQPLEIRRGIYNVTLGNTVHSYNIDDLIQMINDVRNDIPTNVSQLNNDSGYLQSNLL